MQMIVAVVVIIIIVVLLGIYLLLRSARNLRHAASQLDKDWSDIEIFLKQRNTELPRLIQTCRSYMPPDSRALQLVSEARNRYQKATSAGERAEAGASTAQAIQKLFSEAGNYDGLKNNITYVQIQNRLLELEERISERRDLFNEDVARFNTRLARFPGNLFAGKGTLKPRDRWAS